jgi:Bacteriophage translational regulator
MDIHFKGLESLVEVNLTDPQNFLKIKETLTRIGVASRKEKTIYQSCHILHKRGKYYIVHFKELFGLDGHDITFGEEDLARRNTIANLLEDWGLVNIVDQTKTEEPVALMNTIKVLNYKEKGEWNLVPKYNIGRKGKYEDSKDFD